MKSVNSGTHTVNIQNVLFNENIKAFTYSGTVGVECKPCEKVVGMIPQNGQDNLNSSYFDLYWQPSLNTRYYNLFLWEDGTTMVISVLAVLSGSPEVSFTLTTNLMLPLLTASMNHAMHCPSAWYHSGQSEPQGNGP